jgi:quercetin dioxygenase-like cupin family protein
MGEAFVADTATVEELRSAGDTAGVRTTIGPPQGCELLVQRLIRYAPGRSLPRADPERDEIGYVLSGRGTLELDGSPHPLASGTGYWVAAGETAVVDNGGPDELVVVSVTAPASPEGPGEPRRVTVAFADQPELRADAKRTFRYLVNQDAGCRAVTQFVGLVEPYRAPDHSHAYDEVGYVVEGQGLAHVDGRSLPLRPGSVFHLPPEKVHCIENTGPGVMRILGVFHPSGDPASRSYDAARSEVAAA